MLRRNQQMHTLQTSGDSEWGKFDQPASEQSVGFWFVDPTAFDQSKTIILSVSNLNAASIDQ